MSLANSVTRPIAALPPAGSRGRLRRFILRAWLTARRFGSPRRLAATSRFIAEVAGAVRRRRAEPRLTVAVDVNSFFEPLTGVGWYLHQLLQQVAVRDDVRLRLYGRSLVEDACAPRPRQPWPAGPAVERVAYSAPDGLVVPPWRAHQILRRLAPLLLAADRNRVLFAPNYMPPRLFRFAAGARVATVHDLSLYRLPWAVRPDSARALAAGLERALLEADLLVTPSHAVRADLLGLGVAPDRVRAIHHGPGLVASAAVPGGEAPAPGELLGRRYALHVGTLEPRKNVGALLAAWRLLRSREAAPPALVIAGAYGWKAREIRRAVEAARREGWLVHLGYVTPGQLEALYRGAIAVVLPSLYEGFGLPVVEALAAGTPLVLSDIPVFREVAGEAALYAHPQRPDEWAAQLARLLSDPSLRLRLLAAGASRRLHFDWQRTAEETVRAWRDAARRSDTGP